MDLDDILLDAEDRMTKAAEHLRQEFSTIRTGKASPALVENVQVEYYGTQTRLREIAGISTPEPRLIVIQPWDQSAIGAIEKAIMKSEIGITPHSDGKVLRIPIPELTEERRRELDKVIKRMAEDGRVAVRNVRRDANERVKELQKNGAITEDQRDAAIGDIQKLTDKSVEGIDNLLAHKEKEILEI